MAEHDFPVDRSSILLFAAALGEENPIYYDESYAKGTPLGGVIAPPTFAIASAHWNPTYFLRGVRKIPAPPPAPAGPKERSGDLEADEGDLRRVLHGEQRFDYHKPLRSGMRLRVASRPGKLWEREGKRGGKLRFSETITEYRDENGELVVTATMVGVLTEKAVEA